MKKSLLIIGLATMMAACGGGGDGGGDDQIASAEGFWTEVSPDGRAISVAILENGETWGVYSQSNAIIGALYGQTTSSGNTLTGSGQDFNFTGGVIPGSYSGTFVPKTSISITTTNAGSFSGVYNSEYDVAASLTELAGSFNGIGISGSDGILPFSADISLSGDVTSPPSGCSVTGTVVPRPSGKNVFNVSLTFNGVCELGNGTVTTGIAYYDKITEQVLVTVLNSGKTEGFFFVGSKANLD